MPLQLKLDLIPNGNLRSFQKSGEELRDKGIKNAVRKANKENPGWSDSCYKLFLEYLKTVKTFRCEDFRTWVKFKINSPNSLRAFSAIVTRAQREGLIYKADMTKTSDPKSHKTNCNLWKKV